MKLVVKQNLILYFEQEDNLVKSLIITRVKTTLGVCHFLSLRLHYNTQYYNCWKLELKWRKCIVELI